MEAVVLGYYVNGHHQSAGNRRISIKSTLSELGVEPHHDTCVYHKISSLLG